MCFKKTNEYRLAAYICDRLDFLSGWDGAINIRCRMSMTRTADELARVERLVNSGQYGRFRWKVCLEPMVKRIRVTWAEHMPLSCE